MLPPLVTSDLPACGGAFKVTPEDFVVEELPAYSPSGAGTHLFLRVEKRGRDTQEVVRALAKASGISERDIGVAGQKDRQGVTRQWMSVPSAAEPKLASFALEGVRILERALHGNKLRTGHLRANRFTIRLRDVRDAAAARAIVDALGARGLANGFGAQRFGRSGDNAQKGRAVLIGQTRVAPHERRLVLSAFQSLLFNRLLAARIHDGTFARALEGDVMKKLESGGEFVCTDTVADQPRVAAFEISPAGPLFGPKMTRSQGRVAEAEARVLEEEGLTLETFSAGRGETEGARRPYRLRFAIDAFEVAGADVVLAFTLPSGAYATNVLRELTEARPE